MISRPSVRRAMVIRPKTLPTCVATPVSQLHFLIPASGLVLGAERGNYCAAIDSAGGAQSWAQTPGLARFWTGRWLICSFPRLRACCAIARAKRSASSPCRSWRLRASCPTKRSPMSPPFTNLSHGESNGTALLCKDVPSRLTAQS